MKEIGRAIYMLIAMAALAAFMDAAGGEEDVRGMRLATGLCAVGCIMCAIEALFGWAG
jgi:hypothetical protein